MNNWGVYARSARFQQGVFLSFQINMLKWARAFMLAVEEEIRRVREKADEASHHR
jgi:hypothetical protein